MAHIKNKNINRSLAVLEETIIDELDPTEREEIIGHLQNLQKIISDKVTTYLKGQRIKVIFNPNLCLWSTISNILMMAREQGKEGQVAQYLVGAKLQVRFPEIAIGNESYSTADDQLGRHGDFLIGDTSFHVTVAPMAAVYEKCRKNIEQGFKVYLLVPGRRLSAAWQNAEDAGIEQQIAIEAIESFVSQNIDELSEFSKQKLSIEFKSLLETYNKRVDAIESDKSLLLEIPANL